MHFLGMWTHKFKFKSVFAIHGGIYKSDKTQYMEIWKDVSLRLILKDKCDKQFCLPFC